MDWAEAEAESRRNVVTARRRDVHMGTLSDVGIPREAASQSLSKSGAEEIRADDRNDRHEGLQALPP